MATSTPPSTATSPHHGRPSWATGKRIAAFVLVVLGIVLVAENSGDVRIRLLVPVVTMPLWLAFVLLFAGGLLAGGLLCARRRAASAGGGS